MTSLYRILSSSKLALILLVVFAIAMATATFIENDFGTATAWQLIYNALWFELVMLGLCVSFVFNISKYKLWRKQKWPILLFHLSFILVIIGAGVTRYISESGVMRIREGESSSTIISNTNYFQVHISDGDNVAVLKKQLDFSPLSENEFTIQTDYKGQTYTISLDKFVADAQPQIIESEKGQPLLELVIASEDSGRETIVLRQGETETIGSHNHSIGFNVEEPVMIHFKLQDNTIYLQSTEDLSSFVMSTQEAGTFKKDSLQPLQLRSLYRAHDFSFVPISYHPKGDFELVSTSEKPKDNDSSKDDALVVTVQKEDEKKTVSLLYREGFLPTHHQTTFDDVSVTLSYGSEEISLPFEVRLNDFQLERYPGSTSPSSYASEVTVLDQKEEFPYRIFMNNVLDYKGYRFYQASYDTDELGTVLAVNKDRPGTLITYFGYLLMGIGMLFSLFGKHSRFWQINQKLRRLKKGQLTLLIITLFSTTYLAAFDRDTNDDIFKRQSINKHQSELFGRLLVQDLDGRIKPINTLASEFLRKLSGKPYYKSDNLNLSADQAFLAMHMFPNDWQQIPVIKIDRKKGGDVFKDLKTNASGLVSFQSLLGPQGEYLLAEAAELANVKKPAERSESDKEILKVDERFNILYNVLSRGYLKIFPNKNDTNNTWFAPNHHFNDFPAEDAAFVKNILPVSYTHLTLPTICSV